MIRLRINFQETYTPNPRLNVPAGQDPSETTRISVCCLQASFRRKHSFS